MATAWDKLEQLLTCAICLDRFRNPKMLPCQHSFCQEPCMEGLQDYARRQIKCPECRAEHRIPFQGIQSYPTNVTLQRFLELHQSITGEEPEPVPSMMERCGVCQEKSTVTRCSHCDRKVCPECKEAHLDILKREISRICHQVRRALNRLQDALSQTERSVERLTLNSVHIRDEIEEIVRRFIKDIKAQEDKMLKDLENYSQGETKNLNKMKEDLEIEFENMKDNCDLVEKNVLDPDKNWNDIELVEYKDIFVKTLDFLRNFDADAADYTRGMKFLPSTELDSLRRSLINFGELKLPTGEDVNHTRASSPSLLSSGSSLTLPQQNLLMRSQSDHRLAAQFARRDSRINDLVTSQTRLNAGGYSDSEKDPRDPNRATSPNYGSRTRRDDNLRLGRYSGSSAAEDRDSTSRNRFLRDSDAYRSGWARPDEDTTYQFKSRFMRERGVELGLEDHDYDPGSYTPRSVRFEEPSAQPAPAVKVFDTHEAPRGPLSGIVKISDTAHYMERAHENEVRAKADKERKEEETRNPPPPSMPAYQPQRRPPSRQVSEDEIEKQKKMNQVSAASSATPAPVTSTPSPVTPSMMNKSVPIASTQETPSTRPVTRRIGSLRDDDDRSIGSSSRRGSSDISVQPSRRETSTVPAEVSSALQDDNDDTSELSDSNISRVGRRRRGSFSNEDSKESNSSSSRSSQVSSSRQVTSGEETSLSKEDRNSSQDSVSYRRGPITSSSGQALKDITTINTNSPNSRTLLTSSHSFEEPVSVPTSDQTSVYTRTRAASPYVSRRSSSDYQPEKTSTLSYSAYLRSRSPSIDRDLKIETTSHRPLLSRTNSLEEQGRYSTPTSYSLARYSSRTPLRLARSSTVSSLAASTTSPSSSSRYSDDTHRSYRSRPSSPVRYTSTSSLSTSSSSSSRRPYSSIGETSLYGRRWQRTYR